MDKDKSKKKDFVVREQPMTYDDYASLDDGNRYELVEGKLELMSPGPNLVHQAVLSELNGRIMSTCKNDYFIYFAPLDVIFSATEVRQPDLIMIHRSRQGILSRRGVEGAPDLVVEILSPSTLQRDKIGKLTTYAQYKVPEYWIIDPDNGTLEQYRLNGNSYSLVEILSGDEPVQSTKIGCVNFTMDEILRDVRELPN